ncbi:unnamed protein product [Alternaria alternata]
MSLRMRDYRVIAARKQTERNNKIPPQWLIDSALRNATSVLHIPITCGVLSDVECDITSKFDATTLLKKLKEGTWSAEQVTTAFCKRAAIAQQLVNCLTEIFFGEAIERARLLDKQRKENPSDVLPPFWGLPISLKDSFDILGHDSSTGLACYVGQPAEENSSLAAMLLDLGAVFYCKTNVSQLTIPADSDNNVFGRTLNPRNPTLTAGGSTGGEGALIALRGSILGVGTDIGGSIRVPALCNGIYGFQNKCADGVRSSVGPMATSIRDCSLFMRTVMESETWRYDSSIISLPWRNLPVKKKLCIGLVEDDGIYTPSPPVRRGLKKAADLLRNNSEIELVPITLPNTKEHYNALLRYFSYPGSDHYREQLARTGEPEVPSLKAIQLLNFEGTSLEGLLQSEHAILMPPAPHTAVPLDHWTTASYTGLWNYLDFPAVVIPVDDVAASDALDKTITAKYGPEDAKVYSLYTGPEFFKDTPVSIQLVGYRHADEALSNAAVLIDSIINTSTGK